MDALWQRNPRLLGTGWHIQKKGARAFSVLTAHMQLAGLMYSVATLIENTRWKICAGRALYALRYSKKRMCCSCTWKRNTDCPMKMRKPLLKLLRVFLVIRMLFFCKQDKYAFLCLVFYFVVTVSVAFQYTNIYESVYLIQLWYFWIARFLHKEAAKMLSENAIKSFLTKDVIQTGMLKPSLSNRVIEKICSIIRWIDRKGLDIVC